MSFVRLLIQILYGFFQRDRSLIVQHGYFRGFKPVYLGGAYLEQIKIGKHGILYLQYQTIPLVFLKNISRSTQINRGIRDHGFPYRVYRRIGDLREHLLEVIEQRRIFLMGVSVPIAIVGSPPFSAMGIITFLIDS